MRPRRRSAQPARGSAAQAACASRLRSAEHAGPTIPKGGGRLDGEGRRGRTLVATANAQFPRTSTQ